MKLLLYHWNSYFQYDLYEILKNAGISYDIFEWKFRDKNDDEEFISWFHKNIDIKEYDVLLSVNYYPLLSQICEDNHVKYIAWCYDNPLNVENIEKTLGNICNYVFVFDKIQCANYRGKGFDTVHYQMLGVNANRLKKIMITAEERQKYSADVSFVGNLYHSVLEELVAPLNDYTRGYLKSLMDLQAQIYGSYLFDELISQDLIDDINRQYLVKNPNTHLQVSKEALTFAMASGVTREERIILLNLCGNRYDTKFYSYDQCDAVKNVTYCGSIDYIQQMPKVFACTKINLNPTLRIIQSGIPQRALDIMACGGFLLSNYQLELAEYFKQGKHMIMYESIGDAIEKIEYYLLHDAEREAIAVSGRKEVLQNHSMQDCLKNIFAVVGIEL